MSVNNDFYAKKFVEFLQWERASRDTIDFKRIYVDMAGDILAGLALSEILFWHLPNKEGKSKLRVERDGQHWIACARDEWWTRCRMTPRQVDRVLNVLVKQGLIVKDLFMFAGRKTVHVRLMQETFLLLWESLIKDPVIDLKFTRERKFKVDPVRAELKDLMRDFTRSLNSEMREDNANPDGTRSLFSELPSLNSETITETTTETTKKKDSLPQNGNGTSPDKPKTIAPRKPFEDAIVQHVIGIDPLKYENWSFVGKLKKQIVKADASAVADDVAKFAQWCKDEGFSPPNDADKLYNNWLKWRTSNGSDSTNPLRNVKVMN